MRRSSGNSLMEMVVVLAILSLLATMAAPYATKSFKRDKEIQLRETLRTVRTAIDQFHADMEGVPADKKSGSKSSANGYPVSLHVLVEGIEKNTNSGERETQTVSAFSSGEPICAARRSLRRAMDICQLPE